MSREILRIYFPRKKITERWTVGNATVNRKINTWKTLRFFKITAVSNRLRILLFHNYSPDFRHISTSLGTKLVCILSIEGQKKLTEMLKSFEKVEKPMTNKQIMKEIERLRIRHAICCFATGKCMCGYRALRETLKDADQKSRRNKK